MIVEANTMDPAQVFVTELLSRQKTMHELTERGDSDVQQFYCGAAVFITGGSGFLGKQLIEKLFRATKISKVFILMRAKKGKAIQQRLDEMLQDPVFSPISWSSLVVPATVVYDLLRKQQPDFAEKIVPVAGEVGELRLGMSDEDWNTVAEQAEIIFHMAATTRFDDPLRMTTIVNIRGTREALILGKACKKLKSYVHVSTAYSHACDHRVNAEVLEDFYQSPVEPHTMIKLAETVDEKRLNNMTAGLIKNWPNTYPFTKAIAEELVRTMSDDLPICIVRPAIVICAQREPHPGWLDMSNVYGASGLVLGIGLGVMHTLLIDDKATFGLIPVDYVNNAIIAAGWETAMRKVTGEIKTKIYTVISSTRNPGIWERLQHTLENETAQRFMSPAVVGHSLSINTTNPNMFWIYTWLLHLIPAYIMDGVCVVLGKERRFTKLYTKIYKMILSVCYYALRNWEFVDKNTAELYDNLSAVDQEIFDFDVNKIDWREYMIIWVLGLRKYIIKDGLEGTEYGIKKRIIFKIVTYSITSLYVYFLYKIICFSFVILTLIVKLFW